MVNAESRDDWFDRERRRTSSATSASVSRWHSAMGAGGRHYAGPPTSLADGADSRGGPGQRAHGAGGPRCRTASLSRSLRYVRLDGTGRQGSGGECLERLTLGWRTQEPLRWVTSPKRQRVNSGGNPPLTRWRFGLVCAIQPFGALAGRTWRRRARFEHAGKPCNRVSRGGHLCWVTGLGIISRNPTDFERRMTDGGLAKRPHLSVVHVSRHARGARSSDQGDVSRTPREAVATPRRALRHRPTVGHHRGRSAE